MTFVQRTNPEGEAIQSNVVLPTRSRNVAARFMDGNSVTITTLTAQIIPSDTLLNTAPSIFVIQGDDLVVERAGIYQLSWQVTAYSSGGDCSLQTWLQINPNGTGSYSTVTGTTSYQLVSSASSSGYFSGEFHLGSGDWLRVLMFRNSGSGSIITFADRIYLGIHSLYRLEGP